MHDAVTTPRRPVRPLTHLLAALGMAAALLPGALLAHQGADHASALAAAKASATATPTQVQGRVGAIVVTNRMTAQQHVHPVLEATNGTRYLLKNAGALPTGATAAVTGRVDGQVLWSESTRTLAAPPAKSAVQRAALTGTLRMFHVDYQDGRPAEFGYSLVPDSGKQNIVEFGTLLPMLENGMRATVAGPVNAQGYIAVDTIDILAPPVVKPPRVTANGAGPPVGVTTGYLTMPLQYPNNAAAPWTYNAAPFTVATITTNVYGAAPALSAAEYYKEVSFGAQLLSGKVSNAGGAWLKATVARPTACGTSAELNAVLTSIETQADAAATAVGDIPGNYTGVLYVVDALPCGWAGLGYIGWERAYTKGTSSLGVVGHELGHNFGLYHAGSLDCAANVIAASGCSVTEYGDPFDIMGNIRSMHFNAYQKQLLGYIAGSTVATHSAGSTTYTLGPIELAGQSQYAVKVPTSNTKRTYWLEFRQPIGFDSALASFPNNGAQVRLARPFENNSCGGCTGTYDDTQFLDMTPSTGAFTDGALVVNQSYTDSTYNIVIDVLAATSSALTVKVTIGGTQTGSTTTLASGTNPSTQGQSVTFTATVTGAAPTGTVAFRDAGTAISGCTAVALTGSGNTRTAACATSALATGVHSIVADYSGDTGNTASSSTALSQSVKAASATTLATSGSPVTAGTSVTFTASVTGSAPTGAVAFTSDGAGISGCSAISLAGTGNTRTAACTTSSLAAGTHAIVASYAGNSANGASTSAPLSQVVSAATTPTTTTLASGTNPSVAGATVTFTASVTGTAPTGAVAFTADGNGIAGCGAVSLAGSGNTRTAACTTSALAAGVRAIVASYGGDTGNASSSSAPLSQTVKAASTTTVATSGTPVVSGTSVTFTASVAGSAPTGAVAFTSDGVTISGCGAVGLTGSGDTRTSACTTASLAIGAHAIVATYAGDAANANSASAPLSQVISAVAATPTTTNLASGTNPSVTGAPVTFTASVTGAAPTGTVAFTADGATIAGCGTASLAGSGNTRTAACTTGALAVGTRAIVAGYGGDAGNLPSASSTLLQAVNGTAAVATRTTVTSARNPSPLGIAIPLTATIASNPPVTGGTVTFTAHGATISGCANVAVTAAGNARRAVCPAANLASGAHSIVASYSGDATGLASVSPVFSQVVPFPTIGNTLQFANATLAVNETAGSVAVMVTRIGDASAAAHAGYATAAGTATANADFTAASGTLTWADGDASPRFIVIPIAGDALAEPGETFTVSLSNPVGATLGAASATTVTIVDDESAAASMPGTATVVQHPYGALTVQGGTLSGSTITNLQSNAVIQLGSVAGAPGSFAKIDFQGLDIGAGNTLTIRAGAPGQTVYVVNAGGAVATIAGTLQAQAGAGAPAPYLYVQSPNGLTTATSGAIRGPAGLTVDTLAGSWTAGQPLVNQGSIDGAASLQLFAAKVNGGGAFRGNAIVLATFGNLNNPVNGAHFLSNGLNLHPGSGNALDLTLAAFGGAPQFMNLMLHGDATIGMPSAWPNGSALPPNNRPVMPGETRAAGVPDPAYGGGSMIVQATGKLTLEGGASGDFVFPGSVVLRSAGALDVKGTTIDNAWTTSGATYQGVFLEAASVTDSGASARIAVRTNDRNWVNLMPRALVPVNTWTLQRQGNGTAQFQAADGVAPHLNFFSITTEAGAAGACYTCLVNTEVIDFTVLP